MFDQKESTQRLHASIVKKFADRFPQEHKGHVIEVSNVTFKDPTGDYADQNEAFLNESDMATVIKADVKITKEGEKLVDSKGVTFASVPFATNRGTYIVGGNENVFINQMVLRPGVYVNPKTHLAKGDFIKADIRAGKQRMNIIFNETKGTLRLDGLGLEYGNNGGNVDVIPLLNLLGVSDAEIQKAIGDEDIFNSLKASSSKTGAAKVFKGLSTEPYKNEEQARTYIEDYFKEYLTFDEKAKKVSQAMIGEKSDTLDTKIFLATLAQMFKENKQPNSTPDVDDYRFKEVRNSEDVIALAVDRGINEWAKTVKKRISYNQQIKADKVKPLGYMQKELRSLYSSNLMEGIDSGNPLDLHQKRHKVTQFGPGGLTDRSLSEANRNLQDTAFSKMDPVETPQSGKLGATQHLAKDAVIRDGTIRSKFYKVKGKKIDRSKIIDTIDPLDEYDEYVAFNNPQTIDKTSGWSLKGEKVMARHKGDFIEVPVSKITLMDITPSSHLGHATALVPFGAHNDGARMLMGGSMQRQALALEDPDEPLVQSVSDEDSGRTMEQEMAESSSFLLKSPVAGKVSAIGEKSIEITSADGKKTSVDKLNYFSTGKQGGYINHKPVVAVGDEVKAGSLLADGWQSKNGKMALGKNTRVAYMPYEGYNFEDGVVVSESFAKKMASEEMKTIEYEIVYDDDTLNQPESKKKLKELLVSDAILSKLDANGVIKKGSVVSSGDVFVASVKLRKKAEASAAERLLSRTIVTTVKDLYVDKSKYVQGYQKGKIIEVNTIKKGEVLKVSIKMLSFKPMEIGDKLAGRHGNKGTITKILPDAEMPHTKENQAVELIMSPLAVPSRKNMGQLLEVNAGLIAEKKGMTSYNVHNFDKEEKNKLMRELEEIGMPDGKQVLINPKTGMEFENPITVGPMYVMKLKHKVEGKISARSYGSEDRVTAMPKKVSGSIDGDRNSPQGVGGMEFWSLTSAGAVENIHEMTTLKSDGSGSAEDKMARINIYQAIRNGTKIPDPVTPQTLKVLQEQLYGAGLQITPLRGDKKVTLDEKFTSLMLQPISKQQLEDLDTEQVIGLKTIDGRTGEADKDGLYSKKVFGENGDKWGRIEMGSPIPNPVFLDGKSPVRPYESMLLSKGIPQKKIIDIVEKGKFLILDPKETGLKKYDVVSSDVIEELVDIEEVDLDYATGGDALKKLLADVDMKAELTVAENGIKNAKNAKERSTFQRHVRTLSAGLDNGYKPDDYLLPFVPVLPVKYREPVKTNNSDQVAEDGITLLYQSLMKKNNELDKALAAYDGDASMLDKSMVSELEADRYKTIKNIMGVGQAYKDTKKNIEYDGILHRMSSKKGFLRENMQKKLQDYSGRSVIVVDPELSMDETGIPEDMAAEIFAPKIERELQRDRYTPKEIMHHMKERDEPFRRALSRAVEDEVVILNRQPSLHRHSLQAFKPVIRWDSQASTNRAIGLNPLVTTGFNADFDGDSLINSVFARMKIVDVETEEGYGKEKKGDSVPLSPEQKIRYKYGLINMRDFPRGELTKTKGNIEVYSVPEGVEVLTVWNNKKEWLPVESFSVHKDLEMLEVKTNSSRTIQVSNDHSLVSIDEELEYERVPATLGMTIPRLKESINSSEYELIEEIDLPIVEEKKYSFSDKLKLDIESGYFFGAYIGDGWVATDESKRGRAAICMADSNGSVMERIKAMISSYSTNGEIHVSSVDSPHEFEGKKSFCVKRTWYSSRFSTLLRNEIGSGAANKKLPSFWIQSPEAFRWGLLSGLIDTDGSVMNSGRQTHINLTTISRTLAYEVVGLAHSLNLTASVTVTQTPRGDECYVVTFTQESIEKMRQRMWLANEEKIKRLASFKITNSAKRNKYTPKLSNERLTELRKEIGSPRFKNRKGELIVEEKEILAIKKRKSLNVVINRVQKENSAITRNTALEIIDLLPELFEKEFWAKWKALVMDENVEWELVTKIDNLPFITEAYDLTVPPNYTMVTESGIVVYDTMAVHVPITDAARKEAKEKLMPSQNLLNPTNNTIIMDLKHEMQLGLFYMTRDRIPSGQIKEYKDAKSLRTAYEKGEVKTYDSVRMTVPMVGTVTSTAGKHLFNSALPPAYINYKENVDMKKGDIEKLLFKIMDDPKYGQMGAVRAINDLKNLGFKASTNSGVSIGIKDFDAVTSINKDQLFAEAGNDVSIAPFIDNREEYDQRKMKYVQSKVEDIIKSGVLGKDNPVEIMRASGARGNAGQISAMSAMVGTGKDVTSNNIRPVKSSLLEGTTPNEFWDLSNDSRKGIYDRSVASEKPGELTRYVWLSNKQTTITEKDCGDTNGITLNLATASDAKALYGRILIDNVALKGGGLVKAQKNVPLSRAEFEKIKNEASNKTVRVRSPLSCKSAKGICQYCYGAKPGAVHNDLVPIGEPIGSIAAQAIGEPSQQAIMKTFHTGAGNSNVSSTFESVDNILSLKRDIPNKAVLAEMDGTITGITNDPVTGTVVILGSKKYKLGKLQPADGVRVGTHVKMGESLTKEFDVATNEQLSVRDPRDVLKFQGIDATREFLTRQVDDAFMSGQINDIDRRHMEVVVGNMTNKAIVTNGGTSNYQPDQVAQVKVLQHMNSGNSRNVDVSLDFANRANVVGSVAAATYHERPGKGGALVINQGETITDQHWEALRKNRKYVKVRQRKVAFTADLQNVRKDAPSNNWLERSSRGDSRRVMGEGAGMFMNDQLDNPLTRQMTGLKGNFSTGFQDWATDMKDRFGNLFV